MGVRITVSLQWFSVEYTYNMSTENLCIQRFSVFMWMVVVCHGHTVIVCMSSLIQLIAMSVSLIC